MLENPCRFMTVYLTPYCSYCGDLIVEEGYKCDTCYNQHIPFFLCKKCALKVNFLFIHSFYRIFNIIIPFMPFLYNLYLMYMKRILLYHTHSLINDMNFFVYVKGIFYNLIHYDILFFLLH